MVHGGRPFVFCLCLGSVLALEARYPVLERDQALLAGDRAALAGELAPLTGELAIRDGDPGGRRSDLQGQNEDSTPGISSAQALGAFAVAFFGAFVLACFT